MRHDKTLLPAASRKELDALRSATELMGEVQELAHEATKQLDRIRDICDWRETDQRTVAEMQSIITSNWDALQTAVTTSAGALHRVAESVGRLTDAPDLRQSLTPRAVTDLSKAVSMMASSIATNRAILGMIDGLQKSNEGWRVRRVGDRIAIEDTEGGPRHPREDSGDK